ncbi:MAG: methyltransferase family protein [Steroidobacteraceae bacterium]
MLRPGPAIILLWAAFWISWFAAAAWSARAERRVGLKGQLAYRIVLIAGAIAFLLRAHGYYGPLRLWRLTLEQAWVCTAILALGLAFSWWARIHLGKLWSGWITRKADHRVIDTGPYGIVRHPIYTGLLLAVYATAAAKGTILGLIGALLITLGLWMKAALEERWLREELEPGAYDDYRSKVPMLVPFGPR